MADRVIIAAAEGALITAACGVVIAAIEALVVAAIQVVIISVVEAVIIVVDPARRHYVLPAELACPGGGRNRRLAVIAGRQQGAIVAGQVFVLRLQAGRLHVAFVRVLAFYLRGPGGRAAIAAIKADAVYSGVIDHRIVDVGVMDVDYIHIGDRAVVEIVVAAPVSSEESHSGIAKAVINAAVEADMRTPVSRMPDVDSCSPSPISRSPEQAYCRWRNPGAGHPVISFRSPGPITRRPNPSWFGTGRLDVNRQYRRTNADRYSNRNLRA